MLRVEVEWIDSGETGDSGWRKKQQILADLQENIPVISIGWLMHENPDMVILTQTYDSKHDIHLNPMMIWRKNILRISVLRVRKDYDGSTFFYEKTDEGSSDPDTVPGDTILRSEERSVSTLNFQWANSSRSEDETSDTSLGHIQGALQKLGVGE